MAYLESLRAAEWRIASEVRDTSRSNHRLQKESWEGANFVQALLVVQVPKSRPDSEFRDYHRTTEGSTDGLPPAEWEGAWLHHLPAVSQGPQSGDNAGLEVEIVRTNLFQFHKYQIYLPNVY